MRVGLYGGSFNPAHEGHEHVARTAKARLGLDLVIWLVAAGNPLKGAPAPLAARLAGAAEQVGASMVISDAERAARARATPSTPCAGSRRATPGCGSCGSWGPTTSPACTAGATGWD